MERQRGDGPIRLPKSSSFREGVDRGMELGDRPIRNGQRDDGEQLPAGVGDHGRRIGDQRQAAVEVDQGTGHAAAAAADLRFDPGAGDELSHAPRFGVQDGQ